MTKYFAVCAAPGLFIAAIFSHILGLEFGRGSFHVVTLIVWSGSLAAVSLVTRPRYASFSFLYLVLLAVFHAGIPLAEIAGGLTDLALTNYIRTWYYSEESSYAMSLSTLGCASFALAVVMFQVLNPRRPTHKRILSSTPSRLFSNFTLGFAVILVVLFLVVFMRLGALGSYWDYHLALVLYPSFMTFVSWFYFLIAVCFVFAISSFKSRAGKASILILAVWALFALRLGLRGEVLFPLVAGIGVLARNGMVVRLKYLVVVLVIILLASGIIRQERGAGEYSDVVLASPFNTVAELGCTLRPVVEGVKWIESGDEYLYGGSYWAPIERAVARVLPGFESVPAREDKRLLNVVIQERVGPVGFSPIAEAYLNFGTLGVVGAMFILGLIINILDRRPASFGGTLYIGVAMVPLLISVRNSFTFVPAQIVLAMLLVWLVLRLSTNRSVLR